MTEIRITHRTTVEATAEKRTLDILGQQGVVNDISNDNKRMELKERENEVMTKTGVVQDRYLRCTFVVRA
jgi:hypothetical protein